MCHAAMVKMMLSQHLPGLMYTTQKVKETLKQYNVP